MEGACDAGAPEDCDTDDASSINSDELPDPGPSDDVSLEKLLEASAKECEKDLAEISEDLSEPTPPHAAPVPMPVPPSEGPVAAPRPACRLEESTGGV